MKSLKNMKKVLLFVLLIGFAFVLTGCTKKDAKAGFALYYEQIKENKLVSISDLELRFTKIQYVYIESENKIYYKAPFKQTDTTSTDLYFIYYLDTNEVYSAKEEEYEYALKLLNNRYRGSKGSFKFFVPEVEEAETEETDNGESQTE